MKLAIIGSTGSIGKQAVSIVGKGVQITGLACMSNVKLLYEQYCQCGAQWLHIGDAAKYRELRDLVADPAVKITSGEAALVEFAAQCDYDVLLTSVVGSIGLLPTIEAVKRSKRIALANKETLVVYGEKIMQLAAQYAAEIIPVDSEHSAIFQCLQGNPKKAVEKIILTASGGPFFGRSKAELVAITAREALKHPKWNMGKKISIDSATLMNKGLEVIEARWLFGVDHNNIDVVVHPQSIVHSLVQYCDSSVMAQLGLPDMQLPIHYALHYPDRQATTLKRLSLSEVMTLTFHQPDFETFPCLQLAYRALDAGGTAPCILNAANEVLVEQFLMGQIGFLDIARGVERALDKFSVITDYQLNDVVQTDAAVRRFVRGD